MKNNLYKTAFICLFIFCNGLTIFAETETETETEIETQVAVIQNQKAPLRLLSVGGRIDASFTGGGALSQGFSIPSIRLTAYGEVESYIDYRMSFGQTREVSSQLLPQLMPTEAYIDLATHPQREGETTKDDIRLRFGMFLPLLNPWWSADLGDLSIPDYNETHKSLLLSRDVGAEIAFRPMGNTLVLAVGAFNGSGILSLNANNSKAFSGFVKYVVPIGTVIFTVGNGSYVSSQASKGAINYKSRLASDIFCIVDIELIKTSFSIDAFFSNFEEPSVSVSPRGGSVMAKVG